MMCVFVDVCLCWVLCFELVGEGCYVWQVQFGWFVEFCWLGIVVVIDLCGVQVCVVCVGYVEYWVVIYVQYFVWCYVEL